MVSPEREMRRSFKICREPNDTPSPASSMTGFMCSRFPSSEQRTGVRISLIVDTSYDSPLFPARADYSSAGFLRPMWKNLPTDLMPCFALPPGAGLGSSAGAGTGAGVSGFTGATTLTSAGG